MCALKDFSAILAQFTSEGEKNLKIYPFFSKMVTGGKNNVKTKY